MQEAKLFMNGRSQAVRLPKEFRFSGDAVGIRKINNVVLLIPKSNPWEPLFEAGKHFSDDFMADGRCQPAQQERRKLFE